MLQVSNRARIREMNPEELQEHYNGLMNKCGGQTNQLSGDDYIEACLCASNYYQQTGEAIKPGVLESIY